MEIPTKYDRLCIEYYILVGQATYSSAACRHAAAAAAAAAAAGGDGAGGGQRGQRREAELVHRARGGVGLPARLVELLSGQESESAGGERPCRL